MKKRNCCRRSTAWRKPGTGPGEGAKSPDKALIQEGAVLEKVLPEVQAVGLDNLEEYLRRKLAGHD